MIVGEKWVMHKPLYKYKINLLIRGCLVVIKEGLNEVSIKMTDTFNR
jgi:hypothetical protein